MFEDKKENRRKTLNNKKKKESFKKHIYQEDESAPKNKRFKNNKENMRADEIWEEWHNSEEL
jgi:hypothetical protein